MYAVYAFCREVDDIADSDRPVASSSPALAEWRDEIDALFAGQPRQLVARALSRADAATTSCAARIFSPSSTAWRWMRARTSAPPTSPTLDLYCDRVASAVGHLSVRVFGDPSPAAAPRRRSLGRALQLTNILRDLDEDARRGRLYLPRELLDRHGIRGAEPVTVLAPSGVAGGVPRACRDGRAPF